MRLLGLKFFSDKERKTRNTRMLIRSPCNSIRSHRLRFTLRTSQCFLSGVYTKVQGLQTDHSCLRSVLFVQFVELTELVLSRFTLYEI